MQLIIFKRTTTLCVAGLVAIFTGAAAAVEAVRTEAVQEYVEEQQKPSGKMTTEIFTTAIVDGKPADNLKAIENTVDTVYFYTVLEGLKGQTVTHRWKYAGRIIANADIEVTDDPFSTWSSNKIEPNWTGFWTVEVLDKTKEVIGVGSFAYNHTRNLQMDPDANKAGSDSGGGYGGGGGWGWGRGRGWGW